MKMLDVVLWCLIAAMVFLIGTFFFLNNVVYADYPGSMEVDEMQIQPASSFSDYFDFAVFCILFLILTAVMLTLCGMIWGAA